MRLISLKMNKIPRCMLIFAWDMVGYGFLDDGDDGRLIIMVSWSSSNDEFCQSREELTLR